MVELARSDAKARIDALLNARASSYREGLGSGSDPVCGATLPVVGPDGEPVCCQREPFHSLGPYDRHKYMGHEPVHYAVVWNEADAQIDGRVP